MPDLQMTMKLQHPRRKSSTCYFNHFTSETSALCSKQTHSHLSRRSQKSNDLNKLLHFGRTVTKIRQS
ncbi:hypothetical protein BKA67DRAFT_548165 [Truncatella angustata]|uniref:Uncharacterized protein n=1 Tax=Truncatella angustata TaxID=152316 RepID=A0A9P8UY25_9PEZI|nr:uncharacterized protein BKA67DRAFT_548165 [Truncatella angustata]KAH6660478.1 hypothetical protein BKA67DRAFT_548165 [Truncatella angustata]